MPAPWTRIGLLLALAALAALAPKAQTAAPLSAADWAGVLSHLVFEADSVALLRPVMEPGLEVVGVGRASYYGERFRGRRTASGERFNPDRLTAAHRTLPFGTRLRVTNVRNGRSVVVRITDRGPFHPRRVLDLSKAAARRIGMVAAGTARVRMERLPGR